VCITLKYIELCGSAHAPHLETIVLLHMYTLCVYNDIECAPPPTTTALRGVRTCADHTITYIRPRLAHAATRSVLCDMYINDRMNIHVYAAHMRLSSDVKAQLHMSILHVTCSQLMKWRRLHLSPDGTAPTRDLIVGCAQPQRCLAI
jgi:hypothetical protein